MKALILAAGFGTRLGKLTQNLPKALVRVGDRTILDHNIRKLLQVGITEILINTHYQAEKVLDFLETTKYRATIKTVFEPKLLGTAGTLKTNIDYFKDENFIVMHGDNYFTSSLDTLVNAHLNQPEQILMTMATFDTNNPGLCGTVITDSSSHVIDFFEKDLKSPSRKANAAIYVFSERARKDILRLSETENDISLHLFPKLLGRISAHHLDGEFVDIGTPEGLEYARSIYSTLRVPVQD
jgi:mannose-1-phosphate guanylyltransferase